MLSLLDALRRANHARLERRRRSPPGWLSRLARRIRAKNRERLAHRRSQRQLLASLLANDTAVLEALVFLLKTFRAEERARAEAARVAGERLSALEGRVDAQSERIIARLAALEELLVRARSDGAAVPAAAGTVRSLASDLVSRHDGSDGPAAQAKATGTAPAGRF